MYNECIMYMHNIFYYRLSIFSRSNVPYKYLLTMWSEQFVKLHKGPLNIGDLELLFSI